MVSNYAIGQNLLLLAMPVQSFDLKQMVTVFDSLPSMDSNLQRTWLKNA